MGAIYNVDDDFDFSVLAGASCAFGVFDGVHKGHRFIIGEAVARARALGARALVITFDRDPDELFVGGALRKLMGNEERLSALSQLDGVDGVVVLPFTREFAALEPDEFLDHMLGGHVPAALYVGYDFRFGARAAGSAEDLQIWGSCRGMDVVPHDLLVVDGAPVTSTRIRGLLAEGNVEEAKNLLGYSYAISAEVRPGRGEGTDMGFATANLYVPSELRVLCDGVYAAYAVVDGVRYKAAVSVGVSPTFADTATANVEVHVLDFAGNLYGQRITVQFAHWLRPMMEFASTDELVATVTANITWVRENL